MPSYCSLLYNIWIIKNGYNIFFKKSWYDCKEDPTVVTFAYYFTDALIILVIYVFFLQIIKIGYQIIRPIKKYKSQLLRNTR